MRNHVWRLGSLLVVALAVGCSSAPDGTEHGTVPPIQLTGPSLAGLAGNPISGPNADNFAGCNLLGIAVTPPQFVVRLKDSRSTYYFPNGDGYTLPFPTPWVTFQGGTCTDQVHCTVDPGPYYFEKSLVQNVAGIVSHQFKVYQLTSHYKNDPNEYLVGTTARFYNGTTQADQLTEMGNVVDDPRWTDPNHNPYYSDVEPVVAGCVYVLEVQNATLVYAGYHAQVAQVHDPISWPN